MTSTTILRKKGQFTLPADMREEIGIEENDVMTVMSVNKKAIIIIPKKLESADILKKTAEIAKKKGVSLEELLLELDEIRKKA